MTLTTQIEYYLSCATQTLEQTLPNPSELSLYDAMRYCVFNGGKRLRPLLTYFTGATLNIPLEQLHPIACAIELIHCYSLVHDDLPAMDNADLRRGQPTCHKKYDEATAILAGDALLPLAFEVIATSQHLSGDDKTGLIYQLALYSGAKGMVKGQILDLSATHTRLTQAALLDLYLHKTGKLLIACVQLPLLIKKPPLIETETLLHFAKCLGLGYQIQDDLLDIEGDTAVLGKKAGIDKENCKNTLPEIMGIAPAKQMLAEQQTQATGHLASLDFDTTLLQAFTAKIFSRNK